MSKDIESFNDKGQRHGLWEYYYDGELWYKRFFHNDKKVGIEEDYWNTDGILTRKRYHI